MQKGAKIFESYLRLWTQVCQQWRNENHRLYWRRLGLWSRWQKTCWCLLLYLGNNLISWSSKKQSVITRSSAKNEYRSLASARVEISWLQSLFSKLGICCKEKPTIWCDNVSTTKLARNPIYHSRTKHIEIDIHFIKNKVLAGVLNIHYILSQEQIADIMTRPLSFIHFNYLRTKLNVLSCPLSWGLLE